MSEIKNLQPKSVEEVEQSLKKSGITEIKTYVYQIFKILDNINYKQVTRQIVTAEAVDENIDIVTGYRGYLNPILASLVSYKTGEENIKYVAEMEKSNKTKIKFVAAVGARVASHHVQEIRTIRNITEAYVKQVDKNIEVFRSKLSYYKSIMNKNLEDQG